MEIYALKPRAVKKVFRVVKVHGRVGYNELKPRKDDDNKPIPMAYRIGQNNRHLILTKRDVYDNLKKKWHGTPRNLRPKLRSELRKLFNAPKTKV